MLCSPHSLAKNKLGWQPKLNLSQALDLTAEWYQAFYNKTHNLRQLTEKQINYFEKL